MDASRPVVRRGRGGGRLDRHPDLAVGPGCAAADPRLRRDLRRRGPAVVGRRSRARARRAERHRSRRRAGRHRRFRQRLRRPARRRASRRSPTATSSCCTSRPPTKPGTRARSTRRSRRSSAGTPRSSGRWSTRSTARRSGSCSCPTTRPRARRARTRRIRCPTSSSTPRSPGPGGEYSERGVAGTTPVVATTDPPLEWTARDVAAEVLRASVERRERPSRCLLGGGGDGRVSAPPVGAAPLFGPPDPVPEIRV